MSAIVHANRPARLRIAVFYLTIFLVGASFIAGGAYADNENAAFDIPSMPLAAALEAYGNVSGRDILYNSETAIGRQSTPVHGRLSYDAALMVLLEGTGLSVNLQTEQSYILVPAPSWAESLPASLDGYYARLQMAVRDALCRDVEARPGTYRVALRLWVDAAGDVARYQRLSSSGSTIVDDGLDRVLAGLRIGVPPPQELAQPLTLAILPDADGVTMGCKAPVRQRHAVP